MSLKTNTYLNGVKEEKHHASFYDENNNKLTTQDSINENCVKSVFTIIPDTDIEMISGEVHLYERPTKDLRLHSLIGAFMPDGTKIVATAFVKNHNDRR